VAQESRAKMPPKLIPAGLRWAAHQRFRHDRFIDTWRRCFWCWKWGMEVIEPLLPDGILLIQHDFPRKCFLCKQCSDLKRKEPEWYDMARQQCTQALTNRAIMPHTIRGTTDVLKIISTYVIGCYVVTGTPLTMITWLQGTYDDGYRYTA